MVRAFRLSEARDISWRAQTLFERLAAVDTDRRSCEEADRFLREWRERVGGSDALDRRLALDGYTESACREALCRDDWPDGRELPEWMETIDELTVATDSSEPSDLGDELPFGHVVEPWVMYASERATFDSLSEPAAESLRRWLRRRLVDVASEALFVEFKLFVQKSERPGRDGDVEPGLNGDGGSGPDVDGESEVYASFAEWMRSADGLRYLFGEYPVLARFVGVAVRQWSSAVEEFERRLNRDRDALGRHFGDGSLGDVSDVDVLTDDRHGEGRAVLRVDFESEASVVYKPRSVDAEAYFNDLLARINERGELTFRTVTCLRRNGYGWMEWVSHEACSSEAAIERYCRRAGGLLAVTYALGFTDCHFENVVAAGDHPVVVDAETMMHPPVPRDDPRRDDDVDEAAFDSVLWTGLVPMYVVDDEYDVAGFTAEKATARVRRYDPACWRDPNTDAVEYDPGAVTDDRKRNVPTLDGDRVAVSDYEDAFVAGFREGYRVVADWGPDLLDATDVDPREVELRVLTAPTEMYASLVRAVTSADCLLGGLEVTKKLERSVSSLVAVDPVPEDRWRLTEWERTAVLRLDVPRFSRLATETEIRFDGNADEALLDASGYEWTRDRIAALDADDLEAQVDHVRSALRAAAKESRPDT